MLSRSCLYLWYMYNPTRRHQYRGPYVIIITPFPFFQKTNSHQKNSLLFSIHPRRSIDDGHCLDNLFGPVYPWFSYEYRLTWIMYKYQHIYYNMHGLQNNILFVYSIQWRISGFTIYSVKILEAARCIYTCMLYTCLDLQPCLAWGPICFMLTLILELASC